MVGGGGGISVGAAYLAAFFLAAALVQAGPTHRSEWKRSVKGASNSSHNSQDYGECITELGVYHAGESVPSPGPCETCSCRPPKVFCSMMPCPINPGCRTIQRSNQCCPDYRCECEHNGATYNNGERIQMPEQPCQVCYCKGGEVMCTSITCYHRDDCEPNFTPGQCCPKYDHCPPLDATNGNQKEKIGNSIKISRSSNTGFKREMQPWLLTQQPAQKEQDAITSTITHYQTDHILTQDFGPLTTRRKQQPDIKSTIINEVTTDNSMKNTVMNTKTTQRLVTVPQDLKSSVDSLITFQPDSKHVGTTHSTKFTNTKPIKMVTDFTEHTSTISPETTTSIDEEQTEDFNEPTLPDFSASDMMNDVSTLYNIVVQDSPNLLSTIRLPDLSKKDDLEDNSHKLSTFSINPVTYSKSNFENGSPTRVTSNNSDNENNTTDFPSTITTNNLEDSENDIFTQNPAYYNPENDNLVVTQTTLMAENNSHEHENQFITNSNELTTIPTFLPTDNEVESDVTININEKTDSTTKEINTETTPPIDSFTILYPYKNSFKIIDKKTESEVEDLLKQNGQKDKVESPKNPTTAKGITNNDEPNKVTNDEKSTTAEKILISSSEKFLGDEEYKIDAINNEKLDKTNEKDVTETKYGTIASILMPSKDIESLKSDSLLKEGVKVSYYQEKLDRPVNKVKHTDKDVIIGKENSDEEDKNKDNDSKSEEDSSFEIMEKESMDESSERLKTSVSSDKKCDTKNKSDSLKKDSTKVLSKMKGHTSSPQSNDLQKKESQTKFNKGKTTIAKNEKNNEDDGDENDEENDSSSSSSESSNTEDKRKDNNESNDEDEVDEHNKESETNNNEVKKKHQTKTHFPKKDENDDEEKENSSTSESSDSTDIKPDSSSSSSSDSSDSKTKEKSDSSESSSSSDSSDSNTKEKDDSRESSSSSDSSDSKTKEKSDSNESSSSSDSSDSKTKEKSDSSESSSSSDSSDSKTKEKSDSNESSSSSDSSDSKTKEKSDSSESSSSSDSSDSNTKETSESSESSSSSDSSDSKTKEKSDSSESSSSSDSNDSKTKEKSESSKSSSSSESEDSKKHSDSSSSSSEEQKSDSNDSSDSSSSSSSTSETKENYSSSSSSGSDSKTKSDSSDTSSSSDDSSESKNVEVVMSKKDKKNEDHTMKSDITFANNHKENFEKLSSVKNKLISDIKIPVTENSLKTHSQTKTPAVSIDFQNIVGEDKTVAPPILNINDDLPFIKIRSQNSDESNNEAGTIQLDLFNIKGDEEGYNNEKSMNREDSLKLNSKPAIKVTVQNKNKLNFTNAHHILLTPADLKMLAEYLINEKIKPIARPTPRSNDSKVSTESPNGKTNPLLSAENVNIKVSNIDQKKKIDLVDHSTESFSTESTTDADFSSTESRVSGITSAEVELFKPVTVNKENKVEKLTGDESQIAINMIRPSMKTEENYPDCEDGIQTETFTTENNLEGTQFNKKENYRVGSTVYDTTTHNFVPEEDPCAEEDEELTTVNGDDEITELTTEEILTTLSEKDWIELITELTTPSAILDEKTAKYTIQSTEIPKTTKSGVSDDCITSNNLDKDNNISTKQKEEQNSTTTDQTVKAKDLQVKKASLMRKSDDRSDNSKREIDRDVDEYSSRKVKIPDMESMVKESFSTTLDDKDLVILQEFLKKHMIIN